MAGKGKPNHINPPPFFLLNHQREAPLTPQVWSLEHFSANKLLSMNQKSLSNIAKLVKFCLVPQLHKLRRCFELLHKINYHATAQ